MSKTSHGFNKKHTERITGVSQLPYQYTGQDRFRVFISKRDF